MDETLSKFLNRPDSENLGRLLESRLAESDHLDYKREWPEDQRVAKHILGFANSGGGVMIVGVEQCKDGSLDPIGLTHFRDTTTIHDGVRRFLPDELDFNVGVIDVPDSNGAESAEIRGKKFQIVCVADRPEHLPFIADGESGQKIHRGDVYVRNGAATRRATHNQLQKIVNRRIATGHSTGRELTLKEHLEELRVLYAEVPPVSRWSTITMVSMMSMMDTQEESYREFIGRMIAYKKKIIEEFLQGQQ